MQKFGGQIKSIMVFLKVAFYTCLVLRALLSADLAVSIQKYGPHDFVVYFPARFNFQERKKKHLISLVFSVRTVSYDTLSFAFVSFTSIHGSRRVVGSNPIWGSDLSKFPVDSIVLPFVICNYHSHISLTWVVGWPRLRYASM